MNSKELDPAVLAYIQNKSYKGKKIAVTAAQDGDFWAYAIVVQNESGYEPLPWQLGYSFDENTARDHANSLNWKVLHLTEAQMNEIISSSMRGQRRNHG
jgi:hypothetical protein